MRAALVTLVLGKIYIERFRRYCYANWKAYADHHGIDLVIFTEPLDTSARAVTRSPAWQKCLALTAHRMKQYTQVAWIDSDIIIRPDAPLVFEGVAIDQIAAVEDFVHPSPEEYKARLAYLEASWRRHNLPFVSALSQHEYYRAFGLPPADRVAQTGVMVASPESHSSLLRGVYDRYEDRGGAEYHYEMRPLSYEIVTSGNAVWLDPRFNVVTAFALDHSLLDDFLRPYRFHERITTKLNLASFPRQHRLRNGYRALLRDSYFLHFAGRQADMFLV